MIRKITNVTQRTFNCLGEKWTCICVRYWTFCFETAVKHAIIINMLRQGVAMRDFWQAILLQWTVTFNKMSLHYVHSWQVNEVLEHVILQTSNFVCSLLKFLHVVITESRLVWHLCQTAVLIVSSLPNSCILLKPLEMNIAVFTLKLHLEMFRINRRSDIQKLPGLL